MAPSGLPSAPIERLDPREDPSWDREVEEQPGASIFHLSAWARVLGDCYRHVPVFLRLRAGSGMPTHLPLFEVHSFLKGARGVAAPFADFAGPLSPAGSWAAETVGVIEELARERAWRYVELRGGEMVQSVMGNGPTYFGHRMVLLSSPEAQFGGVAPAAQRCVRKAEAAGLSAAISTTWDTMATFFELHTRTRRAHGSPPQPLRFFRLIHSHLLARGLGFISLVSRAGRPVAGALFLHTSRDGVFKFGASDPGSLHDRPNHLAIWTGIRELIDRGVRELHFGRTSPAQEGLRRFKKSWGASEEPLHYHRFSPAGGSWSMREPDDGAPGCGAFRFMPLPINRMAGRLLYPLFD